MDASMSALIATLFALIDAVFANLDTIRVFAFFYVICAGFNAFVAQFFAFFHFRATMFARFAALGTFLAFIDANFADFYAFFR